MRASREGRGTRATRSRARCGRTDVPKSQRSRPSLPGTATCIHYNVNIIYFLIWFPYMVRPWYGSCAESPQGDQAGPSRPWCGVWEDEDIGVLSPPGIADLPSWSPVGPERYYDSTTTVGESGSDPHSTEALHSCLAALVHTSGAPRGPRGSMGTRIRSVEGGVGG